MASYREGQGAIIVEEAASSTLAIFENIVLMTRDVFNDDIMLRQLKLRMKSKPGTALQSGQGL